VTNCHSPPLFLLVLNNLDEGYDSLPMTRLERVYCNDYREKQYYQFYKFSFANFNSNNDFGKCFET